MKFTLAIFATIFASAISAAPATSPRDTVPSIIISVANDLTGANAAVPVPGDGIARNIPDLFRGTAIDRNGAFMATSAQLTKFSEKTRCFFQNVNWIINLNGKDKTYADLDGNKDVAKPVDLKGFNLQCV